MNKLLIVALFACVATAFAGPLEMNDEASQLALFESDEKEVADLSGDKQIFSDYCIQARDEVKTYLKDGVNAGANRIFNLLVDTVGQISKAVGAAEKSAVEQGSKAISEDAKQIRNAFAGVVMAMTGTGKEQLVEIFNSLRDQLTKENLQEKADDACAYVSGTLKPNLDRKLNAYKSSLLKSPQGEQFAATIKATKLENLGCVTTGRVSKVATACKMVNLLGPTLMEFMGY